jgi:hypothetical protein
MGSNRERGASMSVKKCDVGGDYWYPRIDGPAEYVEPCEGVAVVRYRSASDRPEWSWGFRCAEHWGRLSASLAIEDL